MARFDAEGLHMLIRILKICALVLVFSVVAPPDSDGQKFRRNPEKISKKKTGTATTSFRGGNSVATPRASMISIKTATAT